MVVDEQLHEWKIMLRKYLARLRPIAVYADRRVARRRMSAHVVEVIQWALAWPSEGRRRAMLHGWRP